MFATPRNEVCLAIRHLINDGGEPFTRQELAALARELDSLLPDQRTEFRNKNAESVARHTASKMLIVAGPGTGKSTMFKQRILFWLEQDEHARILALSFVRKLVADLEADIQGDETLNQSQKLQAQVFTLHKYARSIVEQNHGTAEWSFAPHFRIIGQWDELVWDDVLNLAGVVGGDDYIWKRFEKQLHEGEFSDTDTWKALANLYFVLCQFYNAAGFSDLILRARNALAENPGLNKHDCFIFDEYQDFNAAEERLLEEIVRAADSTLIVGDDEQVLYETLKAGRPELIRAIYSDNAVANAMLPFCGRCDFHITKTASHYIRRSPDSESIEKVYLPIKAPDGAHRVRVVACAQPSSAIDYISKFIKDHDKEIEQRRMDLAEGKSKDAFLLILSPEKQVKFYQPSQDQLFELIAPYQVERNQFSQDYFRTLNYYALARFPSNNFDFRKVLHHEGIGRTEVTKLLRKCIVEERNFADLDTEITRSALDCATATQSILDSDESVAWKVAELRRHIEVSDPEQLRRDMEKSEIDQKRIEAIQHQEEEEAELEEIAVKQMAAVELMTIVGSKGLSADHVIIIGLDNKNMGWITRNAFYVAMTRARRSLHILTALKARGANAAHQFLSDLPDENLEFVKYAKTGSKLTALPDRTAFVRYVSSLTRYTAKKRSK